MSPEVIVKGFKNWITQQMDELDIIEETGNIGSDHQHDLWMWDKMGVAKTIIWMVKGVTMVKLNKGHQLEEGN